MSQKYTRLYPDGIALSKYGKSFRRLVNSIATQGLSYEQHTPTGSSAYYVCTGIGTADTTNIVIADTIDGILVTQIAGSAFSMKYLTSLVIPDSVARIGEYAFQHCSFSSVSIPSSVTYIGDHAFSNNAALLSVNIYSNNLTEIDSGVFYRCSRLSSIVIPEGVSSIGLTAFSQCTSLKDVVIPSSVTTIDSYAFSECSSLKTITFMGTRSQWDNISFGTDWDKDAGSYTVNCVDSN